MYTNGLKDRFGSPLLSKRDADARYADKNLSGDLQNRLTTVENDVCSLEDSFLDFQGKQIIKNQINEQHLNDNDQHFVDEEKKEVLNQVFGEITDFEFSTNTTGASNECEGVCIQLSKAHFMEGGIVIKTLSLPYTASGINFSNQYCHVYVYDSSNTKIKEIISIDTQNRTGSNGITTWNFSNDEDSTLPDDYQYIRIYVTSSATSIAHGVSTNIRINVVNKGGVTFDDDECCVWYSSGGNYNYLGDVRISYWKRVGSIDEKIDELRDYVDENFDEITEGFQKNYYHDVWTNYQSGDILDRANVTSFQFAKEHFATGNFDRIELPYEGNSSTPATGYLCVQFFNSSNEVITRHYSENKISQKTSGKHIFQFNFAQTVELPEDYAYVRFTLVSNHYTTPDGTNGISFRVIPIKRNNSFTFNSGTNTNAYDGTEAKNWTIQVRVLERKIAKKTGITYRDYDWSPDVNNVVSVTVPTNANTPWVASVNGWIVTNGTTNVTTSGAGYLVLNNKNFIYSNSTSYPQAQFIVRKGDTLTGTVAYTVQFYPCRSEENDYRMPITTPYDIWKGAVIYDEETGQATGVADLYVPDASAWRNEVGGTVIGKIASVSNEQAVDADGNFLFHIQSDHIENGTALFSGSTITSFNGNLDILKNAEGMFASSRIASWNINLPALTKGNTMFHNSQLASFSGDLKSVTSGWYMFNGCTNLTTVSFGTNGLAALTDGTNMFYGCSLSYSSLTNILNALPSRSGTIHITVADAVKTDLENAGGWEGVEIPAYSSGSYYEYTHSSGWTIRLTSQSGFSITTDVYDVSEANGYIPDASKWNEEVYTPNNLTIVSVRGGTAYDSLS